MVIFNWNWEFLNNLPVVETIIQILVVNTYNLSIEEKQIRVCGRIINGIINKRFF